MDRWGSTNRIDYDGIFLTVRLGVLQFRKLGKALHYMVRNEEDGVGEVTSFGALCTALAATIGTGNIVGVATAVVAGGPGALFWMIVAACFGMATKYAEGILAVKFRRLDEDGHALRGPSSTLKKAWVFDGSGLESCLPSLVWEPASGASEPLPRSTELLQRRRAS